MATPRKQYQHDTDFLEFFQRVQKLGYITLPFTSEDEAKQWRQRLYAFRTFALEESNYDAQVKDSLRAMSFLISGNRLTVRCNHDRYAESDDDGGNGASDSTRPVRSDLPNAP